MKKILYASAFVLTVSEPGNAMLYLGKDFIQSSQDENIWIYQGNIDTPGLNKVEKTLRQNKDALNEIDGYIILPESEGLSFWERIRLIGWAQDKQKEGDVGEVLYRFIWMSLAMLKDALCSMSSGSVSDWIEGHQTFFFRR